MGALMVLVLVAWINFAPRQLGGSVSYVITYGVSMEPRFEQDDLVIVRDAGSYQKGDVIAYRSRALEQPVMHRISEVTSDGYVTKGDNNSWTDTDRPTDADVIGKEWVHVPGAGKVLKWVADPRGAVLLTTSMALFLFTGSRKSRRRNKQTPSEDIAMKRINITTLAGLSPRRQFALAWVTALALFSLLLGLMGFLKEPVASLSEESAYEHTGRFSYSAAARESVVYPEGRLSTGGPLFLKLIDDVTVKFDYELASEVPMRASGIGRLRARLNGSNGWQKTLSLQPPTPFKGNKISLMGTFDPEEIVELTANVQSLTGVPDSFTLSIVPVLDVKGDIGGEGITESFSPTLAFAVDGLQLKSPAAAPGESGGEIANPFEPTLAGSIKSSQLATNRVSLLLLDLPVATARKISVVSFALSLLLMFFLWQRFGREPLGDESESIQVEYGEWLIDVTSVGQRMRERSIEVATMEALVRLADRYERVILHHSRPPAHDYYVEESGAVYRYSCGSEPDTQNVGHPRKRMRLREERRLEERTRLREELQDLEAAIETGGTKTRDS